MLDSIYHMTLKYLKSHFGGEAVNCLPMLTQPYMRVIQQVLKMTTLNKTYFSRMCFNNLHMF